MAHKNIIQAHTVNNDFIEHVQCAYNEAFANLTEVHSLGDVVANMNRVEYMATVAKDLKDAYIIQILLNDYEDDSSVQELISSILEFDKVLSLHVKNIIVSLSA